MGYVETRQIDRDSFMLMAAVRVDGSESAYRVRVRNLSAGGMMAEGAVEVGVGAPVTVEMRGVDVVAGSVAWVEGNRFGVFFAREIDPKLVRIDVTVGAGERAPRFTRPVLSADGTGPLRPI